MKILIACDMEGITGVVDWKQVDSTHPEYHIARSLMTQDVNAAIRGAFQAGASQVIVSDGHGGKTNLLLKDIDPRVEVNCGTPSSLGMIEGVDSSFQGAFFIGYHARAGALHAVLAHTMNSSRVANIWVNDRLMGEIGLNASACGELGVPVLLVSGDQTACAEAADFIPGVETAVVKQATAYSAARCLPPAASQALIEQGAMTALRRLQEGHAPAPVQTSSPVTVRIEFIRPGMADNACLNPSTRRLDGRTVSLTTPTMLEAYTGYRAAVTLGQ